MKKIPFLNFAFLFLTITMFSCQQGDSLNEAEVDYEDLLNQVSDIRESNGFVPTSLIADGFRVSEIDFNDHFGIKSAGIDKISLEINGSSIIAHLRSSNPELNDSRIQIIPGKEGFESRFIRVNDDTYKVQFSKDGSNNLFEHTMSNGRSVAFTNSSDILIEQYSKELEVSFAVANYLLMGIRELYFEFLVESVEGLVFEDESLNSNGRVNTQPCEYYPSVTMISDWLATYMERLKMEADLHIECSNQYCIGCCNLEIQRACLFDICIWNGYGHVCTGYDTGGYYGDCTPNSPCRFDPGDGV